MWPTLPIYHHLLSPFGFVWNYGTATSNAWSSFSHQQYMLFGSFWYLPFVATPIAPHIPLDGNPNFQVSIPSKDQLQAFIDIHSAILHTRCPQVVSWFKTPLKYRSIYHKPKLVMFTSLANYGAPPSTNWCCGRNPAPVDRWFSPLFIQCGAL